MAARRVLLLALEYLHDLLQPGVHGRRKNSAVVRVGVVDEDQRDRRESESISHFSSHTL